MTGHTHHYSPQRIPGTEDRPSTWHVHEMRCTCGHRPADDALTAHTQKRAHR